MHKKTALLGILALSVCLPAAARDVILSWQPSSGAVSYNVYWSQTPGSYVKLNTSPITTTTYTQHHVPVGIYYYVATAVDSNSNESAYSDPIIPYVPSNCDINDDTSINSVDYQAEVNVVLGRISCPFGSCDVNRDGYVNVLDVQIISNAILGTRACPY